MKELESSFMNYLYVQKDAQNGGTNESDFYGNAGFCGGNLRSLKEGGA